MIWEHQPARDPARLYPHFSSPAEVDAARQIVELLDGYTLAIEQAAVYLGTTEVEPLQLLEDLQAQGRGRPRRGGKLHRTSAAILHKEKLAAAIVDQTLPPALAAGPRRRSVRCDAAAGRHSLGLVAPTHRTNR